MPPQIRPKSAKGSSTLHGVSYDDVQPGKAPINITIAPTPSSALLNIHPSLRPSSSPEPGYSTGAARSKLHDDVRRDSGLAPSSTARESRTTIATETESAMSYRNSNSLPRIDAGNGSRSPSRRKIVRKTDPKLRLEEVADEPPRLPEPPLQGLSSNIPTISFDDLTSPEKIQFSQRGSMLISGKRANEIGNKANGHARTGRQPTIPLTKRISSTTSIPQRPITADEDAMSQKVRSMYESGTDQESVITQERFSGVGVDGIEEEAIEDEINAEALEQPDGQYLTAGNASMRAGTIPSSRRESFLREEHELAGGIEDWKDVQGGDVDRYGFIVAKSIAIHNGSSASLPAPEPRIHRVSTMLQLASEKPRRQRSVVRRAPSAAQSSRTARTANGANDSKRSSVVQRPASSQSSYRSTSSGHRISRFRSATNRLPHNRERRFMDEAGDMLTLPPGLADIAENEEGGRGAAMMKRKETEREEKWRKMA